MHLLIIYLMIETTQDVSKLLQVLYFIFLLLSISFVLMKSPLSHRVFKHPPNTTKSSHPPKKNTKKHPKHPSRNFRVSSRSWNFFSESRNTKSRHRPLAVSELLFHNSLGSTEATLFATPGNLFRGGREGEDPLQWLKNS